VTDGQDDPRLSVSVQGRSYEWLHQLWGIAGEGWEWLGGHAGSAVAGGRLSGIRRFVEGL
jgi:hypothetical protein